jgi:hypothetical protein
MLAALHTLGISLPIAGIALSICGAALAAVGSAVLTRDYRVGWAVAVLMPQFVLRAYTNNP